MAELEGRQALEAALAEIDRQIEERQRARQNLVALLGGTASTVAHSPGFAAPSGPTPIATGDPLAHVREQEFAGMSMAEAAKAFLRRVGFQKTPTIVAALQKGGQESKSKNLESALYTALKRHSAFVTLKKNTWELAERRTDLVEKQRDWKRKQRPGRKRRLKAKSVKPGTRNGQEQRAVQARIPELKVEV